MAGMGASASDGTSATMADGSIEGSDGAKEERPGEPGRSGAEGEVKESCGPSGALQDMVRRSLREK